MKNLLVCLVLLFALSCSKAVVPEQKVFENLPSCCINSIFSDCEEAFKDTYTFYNLYGETVKYSGTKDTAYYDFILADTLYKIDIPEDVIYKYILRRHAIVCCNMPKQILFAGRSRKIKFTCRVPTGKGLPPPPPNALISYAGLVGELIRIELVD